MPNHGAEGSPGRNRAGGENHVDRRRQENAQGKMVGIGEGGNYRDGGEPCLRIDPLKGGGPEKGQFPVSGGVGPQSVGTGDMPREVQKIGEGHVPEYSVERGKGLEKGSEPGAHQGYHYGETQGDSRHMGNRFTKPAACARSEGDEVVGARSEGGDRGEDRETPE